MARKRFLTPANIPEEEVCRGLVLPASQDWLGVFSEALSQTIYAYNYEQINDTDLTPEEAASEAFRRYEAWLSATCGSSSACLQPSGTKVYRVSPVTKHYEYLEAEEWVEEPELPPVPEREEPTEEDRKCGAASNAVELLRLVWTEALAQYDASVAAQDAQVDFVLAVTASVGSWFYPPLLGMAGLLQLGWEIVYHAYEILTAVDWDAEFTDVMVCLFKEHSDELDGVVSFDLEAIMHDLWQQAFTGQAYLTMAAQMQWMLSAIGPDGMNMAGSLDLVPADCNCDAPWGREWAYSQMWTGGDWALVQGVIDASNRVKTTGAWTGTFAAVQATVYVSDNTHFTQISADYFEPSPGFFQFRVTEGETPWIHPGGPDDAPYPTNPALWAYDSGSSHTGTIYQNWTISKDGANDDLTLTFCLRGAQYLSRIKVYGTGPCPFTSGTPV